VRRFRSAMKQQRAPVIAESSPRLKHICGLRASERAKCWESFEKAGRKLIDARNLGLLCHHLNDEHFIRIAPFTDLEGASVRAVPGEQELVDPFDSASSERHGWRSL
jgi:hypothetical protein